MCEYFLIFNKIMKEKTKQTKIIHGDNCKQSVYFILQDSEEEKKM